jgi:hypothetical protein
MQNTDSIMELLSGYDTYSTVQEINLSAASEPPATTVACGVIGIIGFSLGVGVPLYEFGQKAYNAYQ